jgi:uncharacterized protein (TIGR02246 family)
LSNLATAEQMIAHYNAQDADAYVALMTEDAAEASYRGAVLRDGRKGIRSALEAMFAEYPENRAEIVERKVLGDYVVFLERVWRTAAGEPFDVLAIYSFEGGRCARVEFVR